MSDTVKPVSDAGGNAGNHAGEENAPNPLQHSASSYLRSAMHQPVQWHEWSAAAFDLAAAAGKPISEISALENFNTVIVLKLKSVAMIAPSLGSNLCCNVD